ncbi:MAG TPA: squalene--hopene cyclase [Acidimicrobiales bacterium]|nr:squalene--hopene cyclase [Acidimicrobiales bacterium]
MALTADPADTVAAVDTRLDQDRQEPEAAGALDRAVHRLVELQDPAGWWKGELETNVTMDAEDLLLRHFLGILSAEDGADTARWIRSQQRDDGTWSTFYGGPPDLSTTIEAYVALRLTGQAADSPHLGRAARWIRAAGGIEASRVFTRIWLALFGEWRWEDLPALPPEVVLLPPGVPLNIYDFACWARQTIVPLTIVATHRPVRPLPFTLDELRTGSPPARPGGKWGLLDRLLHTYGRLRPNPVRALALGRAERWILRRQEADGSWGGIQPPWVYSILALHLQGYPLDHPAVSAALEGLERFTVRDQRGRRLEACQSPVWDTALALVALGDARSTRTGAAAPAGDEVDGATARAARWLLGEEIAVGGDWAVRRPRLSPGGWAFEFENDNYPDIDDTAEVVLALRRAAPGSAEVEAACARAVAWVEGMQCRAGGWAAFDVDNDREACRQLPFCDFGEVIDPPSADVTAHVVEMLAAEPGADHRVLARGVDWLWSQQEADGSWFGRWGANHVYGTGAAVPALVAAGASPSDARIRRALRWLTAHQNSDGGFGEDLRSYDDPSWRGRGASTPSQTAWALLAFLATGERGPAAARAVAWLVRNQREDGSWDEPCFTGTGFPGDFYINYHLYRLVFPVMALGRWVAGTGPA